MKIGEKIRNLRLAADLTQAELADRAQLTKGFISQLENDQTSISVDSLADISEALGISLAEFFAQEDSIRVVYAPEDRVPVEGKGVERFELLVPGSTINLMDPIMLELAPGQAMPEQGPHPGEQFGYVLSGTVTLQLGKKRHRVPKNHCFYFESDKKSQLRNESKATARLLWVTAPPQM
ncbi:MAG: cupin domain-containing protein [Candidatus Zixiibacteriota bacterium]|nr:MAG: cupin domain-containing protein [candidate division Zixibacteria bacterium]